MTTAAASIRPRVRAGPEAFFQPASGRPGKRLYLYHDPAPAEAGCSPLGAVLYVHPFAEEMNKSRRMAALQSRALANAGFAVLQTDLLGCGDSSGDFGDATWDDWVQDVVDAIAWLHGRCKAPLWLWGLRAGCLLATAAAARVVRPCHLLFWQPAATGKLVLQQFLRLKVAAQLADGAGKRALNDMKDELAAGRPVQVAGYTLHPGMAAGLEAAALAPPDTQAPASPSPLAARRLVWFELASQDRPGLSPALSAAKPRWREARYAIESGAVQGPMFWQTTEIEDAPALIDASVQALLREPTTG